MTVSPWTVILDPKAATEERTELNLNSGNIQIDHEGLDWGEAAIKTYLAEQRFGEVPTDYRVPNRVISIPLFLGASTPGSEAEEEEARRHLGQKVGLLQRQGGVLLRQRESGEPLYADIVNASLSAPDKYGETAHVEQGVTLHLECLPDFYGKEIQLDVLEGTGQIDGVLKLAGETAVIKGDYPGRATIEVTDSSGHSQRGAFWGLRSTHYSGVSTAALFYDAVKMKLINGTIEKALTGTFSGKSAWLEEPVTNTWHPFLETGFEGGTLTHVGSYRVFARVYGNAGTRLRFTWQAGPATASTNNEAVEIPKTTTFYIVDLGEIRIEAPPIGTCVWSGTLQVETGENVHPVAADRIWLQPLDDGAGRLRATAIPSISALTAKHSPTKAENSSGLHAGTAWTNPTGALGSFLEAATATLASKASTQALSLKEFGFSIPTGATIKGIKAELTAGTESGVAGIHVGLLKAGAASGTVKENVSLFGVIALTFGGTEDLWGTTWTAAQVNASNFGMYVWVENGNPGLTKTARVDGGIVLTVTYAISGGSPVTADAVIYSSQSVAINWNGAYREGSGTSHFARVSEETGDLPRLPPSGLEERPCELLVKQSRGLLPAPIPPSQEEDAAIDAVKAIVYYRPCYLIRI